MGSASLTRVAGHLATFLERHAHDALSVDTAPLVIAASAGRDSTALVAATAALHRAGRIAAPVLAHVDHGRHARHAEAREAMAALATRHGIRGELRRIDACRGDEATLRRLRYDALEATVRALNARYLLTAHHREDQRETVLFRVLRGTTPRGLCGLAPARRLPSGIRLLRPCLDLEPADLAEAAVDDREFVVTDPSNASLAFTRNRLRHLVLPRLRARHGRRIDALLDAIQTGATDVRAREAAVHRAVRRRVDRGAPPTVVRVDLADLGDAERTALLDALRALVQRRTRIAPSSRWLDRLAELFEAPTGTRLEAMRDAKVERTSRGLALILGPTGPVPDRDPVSIAVDGPAQRFGEWVIRLATVPGPDPDGLVESARVRLSRAARPLHLRPARARDRLDTGDGSKRIRAIHGDASRHERRRAPVLVDAEDRPLWTVGMPPTRRTAADGTDLVTVRVGLLDARRGGIRTDLPPYFRPAPHA